MYRYRYCRYGEATLGTCSDAVMSQERSVSSTEQKSPMWILWRRHRSSLTHLIVQLCFNNIIQLLIKDKRSSTLTNIDVEDQAYCIKTSKSS